MSIFCFVLFALFFFICLFVFVGSETLGREHREVYTTYSVQETWCHMEDKGYVLLGQAYTSFLSNSTEKRSC